MWHYYYSSFLSSIHLMSSLVLHLTYPGMSSLNKSPTLVSSHLPNPVGLRSESENGRPEEWTREIRPKKFVFVLLLLWMNLLNPYVSPLFYRYFYELF